jgi:ribosomal-protein-alanine N-acetyltransferase
MSEILAIEFGLARAGDSPMISRMSRDYIEHGLDWRWQPKQIRGLISDPETVVLCARSKPLRMTDSLTADPDDDMLGFGVMRYGMDDAHLMLLAVLPRMRRRGIASRLLCWLEETATTAGMGEITLEVRAKNTGARTFYREHGYCEREYVPRYYSGQESAFRMTRRLAVPAGE